MILELCDEVRYDTKISNFHNIGIVDFLTAL